MISSKGHLVAQSLVDPELRKSCEHVTITGSSLSNFGAEILFRRFWFDVCLVLQLNSSKCGNEKSDRHMEYIKALEDQKQRVRMRRRNSLGSGQGIGGSETIGKELALI